MKYKITIRSKKGDLKLAINAKNIKKARKKATKCLSKKELIIEIEELKPNQ